MSALTALIPLDKTNLSEAALQMVPMLNQLGFQKLILVSVENSKKGLGEEDLRIYLRDQAETIAETGLACETRVLKGDPAEVLISETEDPGVDLLVLATHGRTGIARWRLGSVGDKLIKNAACPRLVIGPNVEIDLQSYELQHVILPLDGSELSELSVPIARHIANLCNSQVDLIRAVSQTYTADPIGGAFPHQIMADDANDYLNGMTQRFGDLKVTTTVLHGRADQIIIEHMKKITNGLAVIASNGRTGFARAVMGSTAERILHGPEPVLIFQPGKERSRLFESARSTA